MNGNKEIKIFKEYSYKELPEYKYTEPDAKPAAKQSKSPRGRHSQSPLRHSQSFPSMTSSNPWIFGMCDHRMVTGRANAQLIREELERTVQDINSSVSFSPDVFQKMVPQMIPYYKSTGDHLFSIPSGLQKAGTPPCFHSNRSLGGKEGRSCYWPVSHLPCILRECKNQFRHSHSTTTTIADQNRRSTKSPRSVSTGSPHESHVTAPSRGSCEYEDEIFLKNLSPSTVELIVSRMTHGLQQERLKRKFKIPSKSYCEPDPISIF